MVLQTQHLGQSVYITLLRLFTLTLTHTSAFLHVFGNSLVSMASTGTTLSHTYKFTRTRTHAHAVTTMLAYTLTHTHIPIHTHINYKHTPAFTHTYIVIHT